jgi:hypothetical protein
VITLVIVVLEGVLYLAVLEGVQARVELDPVPAAAAVALSRYIGDLPR